MAAPIKYQSVAEQIIPGRALRAVTPSDTVDLPDGPCRALYVSVAGNLKIIAAADSSGVEIAVSVGMLDISVKRVMVASSNPATVFAVY